VRWFLEQGLIKIYCPDSIDNESWYNKHIHPADRVKNHGQYDQMILEEVVSRARHETGAPKVATAGCSFGAYHATNFAFRYPGLVGYAFNMGGAFDIRMQLNGYYDDNVYYHNPVDFVANLYHPALFEMGIVLGVGEHDFCRRYNEEMSAILHAKGLTHWLDIRPGGVHDWPVWREMFPHYVSQMKFG
jgi:esterase/lipase superfamily enzyme